MPAVWETLPDPNDFVIHLKRKAGWADDYWSDGMKVWVCTKQGFDFYEWGIEKIFDTKEKAEIFTHEMNVKEALFYNWSQEEINKRIDQKGEKLGYNYFEEKVE